MVRQALCGVSLNQPINKPAQLISHNFIYAPRRHKESAWQSTTWRLRHEQLLEPQLKRGVPMTQASQTHSSSTSGRRGSGSFKRRKMELVDGPSIHA